MRNRKSPLGSPFWPDLVLSTLPCHIWYSSSRSRNKTMKTRILAMLSVITMLPALYMIFLFAPTEATQGNTQRIFYIHVPLAVIGAYGSAILLFTGCLGFLLTRDLMWDRFAACSAEMGVAFTAAQLLTAMMWAKPIWGTWYVFDSRGTLQVVLLLIFISYFMLRSYLPDRES